MLFLHLVSFCFLSNNLSNSFLHRLFFCSSTILSAMFNKSTLMLFALVASLVVAVPLPFDTRDTVDDSAAAGCNTTAVLSNIAQLQSDAQQIQAVGLVLRDPFNQDQALFTSIVGAVNNAGTAASAGDFASAAGNISFVVDQTNTLLSPLIENGEESGIDLDFNELAVQTLPLITACEGSA
ncbi:hypothetical protein B0H11DRAFT_2019241 [Mycena galericulata]|nr:hypothetical protein B0H11DRAFT_2019241 [Mycena galericulata]